MAQQERTGADKRKDQLRELMNWLMVASSCPSSSGFSTSQAPVSMVRIFTFFCRLIHSSCRSCTFCRQARGMPSSPSRLRFWMRSWQMRGSHLRQMMASRGQLSMSVSQRLLQMLYSEASMLPSLRMISPKMWRSAMGERSEKWRLRGCSLRLLLQSWVREWRALSWKVKAQRLGSAQQRWSTLLPAVLVHSSTGSLITLTSRKDSSVLFPAPRLPQIEITPGIFELNPPAIIIFAALKFAPPITAKSIITFLELLIPPPLPSCPCLALSLQYHAPSAYKFGQKGPKAFLISLLSNDEELTTDILQNLFYLNKAVIITFCIIKGLKQPIQFKTNSSLRLFLGFVAFGNRFCGDYSGQYY